MLPCSVLHRLLQHASQRMRMRRKARAQDLSVRAPFVCTGPMEIRSVPRMLMGAICKSPRQDCLLTGRACPGSEAGACKAGASPAPAGSPQSRRTCRAWCSACPANPVHPHQTAGFSTASRALLQGRWCSSGCLHQIRPLIRSCASPGLRDMWHHRQKVKQWGSTCMSCTMAALPCTLIGPPARG